jgi:hypothetical protein
MKFNKFIIGLAVVAALVSVQVASAQVGFDTFAGTRSLVIGAPSLWATTAGINTVTNGPVDIVGFSGRGCIYLTSVIPGGTLTAQVYTSPDSTNWTALANYAAITSATSVSITNSYPTGVGTNLVVTDSYLLPYTATTPTAFSAGFNTPYPLYNQWTNTGAVTATSNGTRVIGINLTDSARYVQVVWTGTGTATNGTSVLGSLLNGIRGY